MFEMDRNLTVYLYTADIPELCTLDFIGNARAASIIRARERYVLTPEYLHVLTGISPTTWRELEADGTVSFRMDQHCFQSILFWRDKEIETLTAKAESLEGDLAMEKDLHQITQKRYQDVVGSAGPGSGDHVQLKPGLIPTSLIPGANLEPPPPPRPGRSPASNPFTWHNWKDQIDNIETTHKYPYHPKSPVSPVSCSRLGHRGSRKKRTKSSKSSHRKGALFMSSDSSSSTTSSSSDTNSSSSSDFSRSSKTRKCRTGYSSYKHKGRKNKKRSRSPPVPKMRTFNGEGGEDWETFIHQFERVAHDREWGEEKKLAKFLDCLSGVAAKYAFRIKANKWKKIKSEMKRRFSVKEDPASARRQLVYMRQNEGESLEEFSQRVYFMALDGYKGEKTETVDKIGVEHFLRGIRDKHAAERAFEHAPSTIAKALKYVKKAIATHKAIYGSSRQPNYTAKFAFTEPEDELGVRLASTPFHQGSFGSGNPSRGKQPTQAKVFTQSVGTSTTPPSSPRRSNFRSNSPRFGSCFNCGDRNHYIKECPEPKRDRRSPSPSTVPLNK